MAEGKENELELDNSAGKKKKMIMIIAVIAILAIGGGAAFFFMGSSDDVPAAQVTASSGDAKKGEVSEGAQESTSVSVGTAIYVSMPRAFRFNVPGASRDRFVEIRAQLLVRGGENEESARKHIPLIESTLLSVFSLANADDLATSAGKVSLKQHALAEVQKSMTDIEGSKVVEQVLFTGFVMQ
ncbi:MAG: flagellar FliL protein [Alteromonadaceae bacterium]|jgi:flagellar FliL protein